MDDETWTLTELAAEAVARIEALPAPKNGQVRAVPDDRTIRYYGTIGLIDPPSAMRGRTALYGRKHLAQVVAIKRMQSAGHSLADIQALWPTLDLVALARLTGVALETKQGGGRKEFWKREVKPEPADAALPAVPARPSAPRPPAPFIPRVSAPLLQPAPVELRLEIAPGAHIVIALPEHAPVTLTPADVRALRAAAAPLVTELAKRGLTAHDLGTLEEKP